MAGGAPVPVPTSDPDQKILSIADLERAASKKLGKSARGNRQAFSCSISRCSCLLFAIE